MELPPQSKNFDIASVYGGNLMSLKSWFHSSILEKGGLLFMEENFDKKPIIDLLISNVPY